jgi:glycolate oxidase FAD binding subunit
VVERVSPAGAEEAAVLVRDVRRAVRIVGGGTKLGWGRPVAARIELATSRMAGVVEHRAGDLTAVVQAGTRLADAERMFAEAGQMLALDPPDPVGAATIGGIVAAGDSGPMRHRYGGPRDLVLGVRVVLADGSIARAGSRVIKNVAGYDLPKLFAGSFGTLGLIAELVVRLHPVPPDRVTVVGTTHDARILERAAIAVGSAPFELECLDVRAGPDGCSLLGRIAGVAVADRARRVAEAMRNAGLDPEIATEDDARWERQRSEQRGGLVVRVSAVRSELTRVVEAVLALGGELVGRASLGVSWARLPVADGVDSVRGLRRSLHPRPCVVLDAPDAIRSAVDTFGPIDAEALMRRVKAQFDPDATWNPGLFREGW